MNQAKFQPRRKKRGRAKQQNHHEAPRGGPAGYDDLVKESPAFEQYYKAQGIVPEDEWDSFMDALRQPLPAAFRITGSKSEAKVLLQKIQGEYFRDLLKDSEGSEMAAVQPKPLQWYPDNMAWQINLPRHMIRRSPALARLHFFLVSETQCGSISRQEAVSMIPPIVLDVQPHHKVLDMCAAPGSKTAQLIEMLHADGQVMPDGVVIANDTDNKRCYMLVSQAKRLHSPCLIVTNHDASSMPNIFTRTPAGRETKLKFDRVLCDVPCSGDGTLRKNADVWQKWNISNGNNLHGLQVRIARRGLEMLAVGGCLVYSTCSLNPVEDEAVIHRLLVESQGKVELVEVSDRLPGLRFCRGVKTWKVMNKKLVCFSSPEDVPFEHQSQIRPQMFPPDPEVADQYHLERCLRILPHHQDTGGFFVAVLKKLAPWSSAEAVQRDETKTAEGENDIQASASPPKKKKRFYGYKEDPFIYFEKGEPVWKEQIQKFYGIKDSFDETLLLVRTREGKKRNVYLTTAAVKELVTDNEDKIKIISTGVKVFVRCDSKNSPSGFRLAQEGAYVVGPFLHDRVISVCDQDAIQLLMGSDLDNPPQIHTLNPTTQEKLNQIETGSVALVYEADVEEEDKLSLYMVGWKGKASLKVYISKNDRVHFLRLIGADTSKFENDKIEDKFCGSKDDEDQGSVGNGDNQNDAD